MSTKLLTNRPVVDLRKSPNSRSERLTQLIMNEPVTGLGESKGYRLVIAPDGYRGWARTDHFRDFAATRETHFVDMPVATIFSDSGEMIGRLSFGTRVGIIEKTEAFGRIEFMGRDGWISLGCVRRIKSKKASWRTVKAYLELMIGVPYLWGGKSGFGIDCSGLVQLVYGVCGHSLPRDSEDQRKKGRRVALETAKAGDLIFSPGHVAIYLGKGKILHSSLKAGGMYIESITPDDPGYREDIHAHIEIVKRII